jgi:hypothetical protein
MGAMSRFEHERTFWELLALIVGPALVVFAVAAAAVTVTTDTEYVVMTLRGTALGLGSWLIACLVVSLVERLRG